MERPALERHQYLRRRPLGGPTLDGQDPATLGGLHSEAAQQGGGHPGMSRPGVHKQLQGLRRFGTMRTGDERFDEERSHRGHDSTRRVHALLAPRWITPLA